MSFRSHQGKAFVPVLTAESLALAVKVGTGYWSWAYKSTKKQLLISTRHLIAKVSIDVLMSLGPCLGFFQSSCSAFILVCEAFELTKRKIIITLNYFFYISPFH